MARRLICVEQRGNPRPPAPLPAGPRPPEPPQRAALSGFACFTRGQAFVLRRPRLWPLGLLPALVTFAVLCALVVLLAVFVGDFVAWSTPFADRWSPGVRDVSRTVVSLMLVGLAMWLSVLVFVSLTLLFGQPFYERLSRLAEQELGDAPVEADEAWHRGLGRAVRETLAMLVRTLPAGLLVFLAGLIPVVGQVAGWILGALVGGRFLALELMAPAMERRGRYLPDRLALARRNRGQVFAFGVPTFVLFLVPLLAVVLMPGAVVGATLLVRELADRQAAPQG